MVKRVFSGVQPSGALTIGNYFGALRNFVKLQHEAECFFCVVNLHALTVPQNPKELYQRTLDVAKLFVASGIDPEKATIFVQSHVPAHSEMSWLLECTTYVGELRRMTQYKDKAAKREVVTSGLFTYPVLMAADILLYQTDEVPVGGSRSIWNWPGTLQSGSTIDLMKRFSRCPNPISAAAGGRIMNLQNPWKMSKSAENPRGISPFRSPDVIRKRSAQRSPTRREIYYDEENKPAISTDGHLFPLLRQALERSGMNMQQRLRQFKKDLAELVIETCGPSKPALRAFPSRGHRRDFG